MNNAKEIKYPEDFDAKMIAPCGMNCGICIAHLRAKKPCSGCSGDDSNKPKHCVMCRIKHCPEIGIGASKFCFDCAKFPCTRLKQLDKRYRTKYGMSMIENLESIQALGVDEFVIHEIDRWKCPDCGGVICVHRKDCVYCGRARS